MGVYPYPALLTFFIVFTEFLRVFAIFLCFISHVWFTLNLKIEVSSLY